MAKMKLKEGADIKEVAAELKRIGICVKQQLRDGSYLIHVKDRQAFMKYLEQQNGGAL